jgi:hypothetical protein
MSFRPKGEIPIVLQLLKFGEQKTLVQLNLFNCYSEDFSACGLEMTWVVRFKLYQIKTASTC